MEYTHTEKIGGLTLNVMYDADPLNPREQYDHVATMVCAHRNYTLGDVQVKDADEAFAYLADAVQIVDEDGCEVEWNGEFWEWQDENEEWHQAKGSVSGIVSLPLYLYDHSGISMSCSEFSDKWDSGQVGFIYVTDEKVSEEWGGDRDAAIRYLKGEVEEYDAYLTGQVFLYEILDLDGECVDSCSGFYGEDHCVEAGRAAVKAIVDDPKHIYDLARKVFEDLRIEYRKAMGRHVGSENLTDIETKVDAYFSENSEQIVDKIREFPREGDEV